MFGTCRRLFGHLSHRSPSYGRKPRRWKTLRIEALEDRIVLSPTSYYVAVNGNNNNTGLSTKQPFATIQQALDMATQPGDTVYVEEGTYNQQLTLSSSGNAQQPITLTNYDGQEVVVNGSGPSNPAINVQGISNVSISGLEIQDTQSGGNPVIDVDNASNVTLSGLTIDDVRCGSGQQAIGVTIEGNCSGVTVSDSTIQGLTGQGAYGIEVDGTTNPNGTLSDLTFTGNTIDAIASSLDSKDNGTYGIWLYDPNNKMANIRNVVISNNQVDNVTTDIKNLNDDCSGIRVEGTAANVAITGNSIHEINGPEDPANKAYKNQNAPDGMGITIYGTSANPITNLTISQNTIYDNENAWSENLTLAGNVSGFQIIDNVVHDVTNIGIDCTGGYPWADGGAATRNGTVSGNTVYNEHCPYDGGFAAGIYVDGGQDIVVTDNISHDNDEGLEVGAEEHDGKAMNITVSDNLLYHNTEAGLVFGAYNPKAGVVTNCTFVNNTVYNNDWNDPTNSDEGQLCVTEASNCVVANNIFDAVGNEALLNWGPWNASKQLNDQLDYNLYNAGITSPFIWTVYTGNQSKTHHTNFGGWKSLSSQDGVNNFDAQSQFADPDFVDAAAGNFALAAGSPALGAGTSESLWYAPLNFNGQTRLLPPNLGAY
jgi:hypothetical protein